MITGTYTRHLSGSELAIYLFHGVVEHDDYSVRNYTRKHLTADAFEDLIGALAGSGTAVSMDDVISAANGGPALPDRAFAVTFDDGFENNLSVAAPILRRHGVPATFYVTTDFIQSNRMSWIDRIEWAFESDNEMLIELPWSDVPKNAKSAATKRIVLDDIRQNVKTNADLDADALASHIQHQMGLEETWASDDPLDRKMNWAQVEELGSDPLFTIGGHTHTHAVLSFLSPDRLSDEIDTSLRLLADHARIGPAHYSYPEGLAHCYSEAVITALKERGVVCCPTAIDGVNPPDTDLFHLKRISVV